MAGRNGRSCGFAKSVTLVYASDKGARDDVAS